MNDSTHPPAGSGTALTAADKALIDKARALAALKGTAAVEARFGGWGMPLAAYAEALGTAQYLLLDLAALAERAGR